ncbi:MAG TPA: hypothetical protein VNV38_14590 [Stellaceae bacterium]|nr:hypothetical protein [Stellaceae bacterium]
MATRGQTGYNASRPIGCKDIAMLRQGDIDEGEARRTNASMGLIVILLLAIVGVVLVRELRRESQIEDCLMQGRRNCVPLELPTHQPNS